MERVYSLEKREAMHQRSDSYRYSGQGRWWPGQQGRAC